MVRWKEPEVRFLEVVGVMGEPDDVSLMGDVGESRSLEPPESFVRFFLRNPRVGMLCVVWRDDADGMRALPCKQCPGEGGTGAGGEAALKLQLLAERERGRLRRAP